MKENFCENLNLENNNSCSEADLDIIEDVLGESEESSCELQKDKNEVNNNEDLDSVSECEDNADTHTENPNEDQVKKNKIVVFVSGNKDISEKDYMQYYMPLLQALTKVHEEIYYVMSDDNGVSELTQMFLSKALKDKTVVSIFGTGEKPNVFIDNDYLYIGGFKTLEERDAAMTASSNKDLHIILGGKGDSAIKNNICRRLTPKYDYKKFLSAKHNIVFWSILFGLVSSDDVEKLQDKLEKENNE